MTATYSPAGELQDKARRLADPQITHDKLLSELLALNRNAPDGQQVSRDVCLDITDKVIAERDARMEQRPGSGENNVTTLEETERELKKTEKLGQLLVDAEACKKADEQIAELAKLPELQYEQRRKQAAKELGIRVSVLGKEVEKVRGESADKLQGTALAIDDPEPWAEPVDGDELLCAVVDVFTTYTVLPNSTLSHLTR